MKYFTIVYLSLSKVASVYYENSSYPNFNDDSRLPRYAIDLLL